ncbi:MAG: tyrosine-type recombinase/integrase [Bacteroidetes bacterium]|nr:tyrosine-type recombinase/integrase [Bacteroidota bacterium]
MAEFNFYLKNPKATGKTAVVLLISSQNYRAKYYTGRSVFPKDWCNDPKSKYYQRTIKSIQFKESPEFNTALDNIIVEAKKITQRLFAELDREPTPWEIKDAIEQQFRPKVVKPAPEQDLFTYWKETAENIIHRTNGKTKKPISRHFRISLLQTLRVLKEYSSQKGKFLRWDNIDLIFYESFKKFLQADLKYHGNTVAKHISNVKYIMGDANERGIKTNQDFRKRGFLVSKEEVDAIYLTESELYELETLNLSGRPGLDRVRDLFLIGCWTGLRFSDFTQLHRAIVDSEYIEIETKKTRKKVVIPILPPLERVISKYRNGSSIEWPKAISNQKLNDALKEIAQLLPSLQAEYSISKTKGGFEVTTKYKKWQLVTTHTARRSFASNMFLTEMPVNLIMAITGHTTEKQFYHYIKITPKKSAEVMRDWWIHRNTNELKIAK